MAFFFFQSILKVRKRKGRENEDLLEMDDKVTGENSGGIWNTIKSTYENSICCFCFSLLVFFNELEKFIVYSDILLHF